jgi:hypothetical protein
VSGAESGFPKGTLVPKLRPTALPFNRTPWQDRRKGDVKWMGTGRRGAGQVLILICYSTFIVPFDLEASIAAS